ncbi:UNVERIFIED_CONTAM: hypothetical protein K2H54_007301 [Gekko kuhli]
MCLARRMPVAIGTYKMHILEVFLKGRQKSVGRLREGRSAASDLAFDLGLLFGTRARSCKFPLDVLRTELSDRSALLFPRVETVSEAGRRRCHSWLTCLHRTCPSPVETS